MNRGKRVLVIGTGPASIQLCMIVKKSLGLEVGLAGRISVRSESFFQSLEGNENHIMVSVQNQQNESLQGKCLIDHVYRGIDAIRGEWDVIVLAVTTDAYLDVLQTIPREVFKSVRSIVLVSPTLGSNSLVKQYVGGIQSEVEIISFSTYLGDTRWMEPDPSHHVITTAMKKKLYIGSTHKHSMIVQSLVALGRELGTELVPTESPLEAETRNISLYVHPPLFMNDVTLNEIFDGGPSMKYVYKLYPEGPITQHLIRDMLAQWQEMMGILEKVKIKPLNLLEFMIDDNYPIRLESLSRADIEGFVQLDKIHQEYLLYIRYTSLLIDPFSTPDETGRYFDFSAVPIRKMYRNVEGELDIPRMPKEDYYRIKIIQGIARFLGLPSPTIDKLIWTYENKLNEVVKTHHDQKLSGAFSIQSFEEDLSRITGEIGKELVKTVQSE
ncbi:opine metallophore biosynthesis dehydrogenase [Rossellomorea sp. YZS02]|uniref:opine metallophore biosynthesis dehydrogenase n=1 Tax=Rossellomorea sp. YZS02 TaxID=3097358 RepID=UPI002A0C5952|nr:opine metallophore biosynthesis dehydrogenase [Rossellomorea sp. YZS02]MDX8345024.1 opine metallophore biosynthesis dehydrogenase [Rossellomorea sp. YZS02]